MNLCVFCEERDVSLQLVGILIRGKGICEDCWFLLLSFTPNYRGWKAKATLKDGTRAYSDGEIE
jgi:hypothetical protein